MPRNMIALLFMGATLWFLWITAGLANEPKKPRELFSLKDKDVITSVSKTPENAFDAASAIYVITQDDIRRSGHTSIPEILRLAPGVEVSRIDSNKWAISSRGFNRQFANKMLVLIDGRTVYTPLFSGVFWDIQDLVIEDIDRIEVIRGPGATLWGANAVNGVINIISKDARLTQGTKLSGVIGNEEKGNVTLRHGGKLDDDLYYKIYAKYFQQDDSSRLEGGDAHDAWHQGRIGFRTDWVPSFRNNITVQGDIYKGSEDIAGALPGIADELMAKEETRGANILANWKYALSSYSKLKLQSYVDYV